MWLEAKGAADAASAAVAGGEDVDVGVADHDGFGWGDGATREDASFLDEGFESVGVGLFGVEAVPAVVLKEEARETEVIADVPGGVDGFVGQDGHESLGVCGADSLEGFEYAGVNVGVVEFMDTVVVKEECKRFGYILLIGDVAFGVADGAADEHGGSVADVAGDDGLGEGGLAEVGESGVDGVAEIDAGVDEGAVEIEDDEEGWEGERHGLRVNDGAGVSFVATGETMRRVLEGKWTRRRFVAGVVAAGAMAEAAGFGRLALAQTGMTGETAMQKLMAGNERYIAGKITSFPEDLKILQEKTVLKQEPFAAVLACADSRVPVEILFDQSIGHVFVTRVAGNVVTPEVMATLEYGVAVLGLKAILILGHTNCGAISAAVQVKEVPGQISVLYQHLMPGVREAHGDVVQAVKANVVFQTRLVRESSTLIAKAMKESGVKVSGGVYDLENGRVNIIA
jgi:carbonic anhydrase